ncbi:hypothetical protein MTO96_050987 [Rhipicephalus appendiculatus]
MATWLLSSSSRKRIPFCFGGQPAPQVITSDNSSAEKATLHQTCTTARQLLCHFHVAQAELRWLTALRNRVDDDKRRQLTSAFQLVMYADTAEKLEAATAELKALPHEAFFSRVETVLQRQEDGIMDSVALVWEKYFESRVLRHAYSRVAVHQLLYKRLLSRMPDSASEAILTVGSGHYVVPSATHPSLSYEVFADIGLWKCSFGKQARDGEGTKGPAETFPAGITAADALSKDRNLWSQGETQKLLEKFTNCMPEVGPMKKFKDNKTKWTPIAAELHRGIGIEGTLLYCENRLEKVQFRWACPRSSSGGPSKVQERGLVSGTCQGAVAEAGFVNEAYLVRSSWVVA